MHVSAPTGWWRLTAWLCPLGCSVGFTRSGGGLSSWALRAVPTLTNLASTPGAATRRRPSRSLPPSGSDPAGVEPSAPGCPTWSLPSCWRVVSGSAVSFPTAERGPRDVCCAGTAAEGSAAASLARRPVPHDAGPQRGELFDPFGGA